jgi:hypothetical protein
MKILFLLGATSRIRNFDHTILELADHGHVVQLAGRLRKGAFELPKGIEHARISGRVNPTQRSDDWRDHVDLLRGARDYVRYFDPRYARATRLVRRAYDIAPTEVVRYCDRHPWVKQHWRTAARALAFCEQLIPSDPGFEAFLREERPDVVLVTPLVTFESYQTDYVKAAHRLGIPVIFIPFSWDNLTNKGLMRVQPDRVIVWNDVQRREAVDLHGCDPKHVVIVGAARFDDFFARRPATSRAEFFASYGLDPAKPMLLYLGSSQLTGPNEMELIRRWAESFRASEDATIRGCGILVRPHPALRASWTSVDMSALGNIAISLEASRGADQELFDSLYHAHAAVGLNTSAMLEAAIVGRPVHTLLIPGFDEGQVGTMHFHYLVEAYGGLATIARDFDEHHRQLVPLLQQAPATSARSRSFAEQFLRPRGIDIPVSPILTAEIERLAKEIVKRPKGGRPVWQMMLGPTLLASLQRRRVRTRTPVDATIIGSSMSLRVVRTALEEIQSGTAPVFVGPWNDSIANELLYWIPFVRWASAAYGIAPERLIVMTNGGSPAWYASVGQRSIDARSLFSAPEIDRWMSRTVPQHEQDYKQAVMSPFDSEVIERAARAFELSDYQVLHPSLVFRVISRLFKDRALERLPDVLRYERRASDSASSIPGLPEQFVAVSTAFTEPLPNTPDNQQFLSELVAQVSAENPVVLVDCPPPADIEIPRDGNVVALQSLRPDADASTQTEAMTFASAFVGSHGDLAVLASFCGTPVVSYQTERLPTDQAERLEYVAAHAGWGPVSVRRAHRFKGVQLPKKARVAAARGR